MTVATDQVKKPRPLWRNAPAKPGEAYVPTDMEQYGNVCSHAIAGLLSVVGVSDLLHRSQTNFQFFIACVYGSLLCALFISSTGFHYCCLMRRYTKARRILHFCDRMVIYLFIAASYMPWLLLSKSEHEEFMLFACVIMWIFAAFGTVHQFRCVVGATACSHERVCAHDVPPPTSPPPVSKLTLTVTDANHNPVRSRSNTNKSFGNGVEYSVHEVSKNGQANGNGNGIHDEMQGRERSLSHSHYRMPHVPPTIVFYVTYATFPALILYWVHQQPWILDLACGGFFYLFGVIFFKLDGVFPLAHTVWHTFVALGAAKQFFAIRHYLYNV